MDYITYLDKLAFPLLVILVYVSVWLLRRKIMQVLAKKFPQLLKIYYKSLGVFSFRRIGFVGIFSAVFIAVLVDVGIVIALKTSFLPYDEPMWFLLPVRGILNPVGEEIFFRGFYGLLFLIWIPLLFNIEKLNWFYIIPTVLIQSFVFTIMHGPSSSASYVIRFVSGTIYCLVYVISGKNLLPGTIAHSTHNIIISLGLLNW